jgi:hypothetical protein
MIMHQARFACTIAAVAMLMALIQAPRMQAKAISIRASRLVPSVSRPIRSTRTPDSPTSPFKTNSPSMHSLEVLNLVTFASEKAR